MHCLVCQPQERGTLLSQLPRRNSPNDAITTFLRPLCRCSEQVVLLFGTENHDNPRAFETVREITKDEANLHIYTAPGIERLTTSEGDVQILALPGFDKGRLRLFVPGADKETENHNATALINDVLLGISTELDKGIPAILVAHYTIAGAEADNGSTFLAGQDVVILPSTIDSTRVDLACFGHIHHPQKLPCNTPAYYCGSPNQLTFNDEGTEHGFYIHQMITSPIGLPGTVIESKFINTPERRHYTYRLGPDDIAAYTATGKLPETPAAMKDALVRVRYTCTPDIDKALNRAELQKALVAAGAFYVAEVLPEDIEDVNAASELTEHEGPTEALHRYLERAELDPATISRLAELAAPLIKRADDGRDADKRTGSFAPVRVEVKNYRSYSAADFTFEDIRMAMVNGQNGVGKSSLFMDAIADCLFEQTRKEDIGGWVRDGTKSGAITFEFAMGPETYHVIRTRTKVGRGTLALHRRNPGTYEWLDESDTTMKLTQARIERILGMDCNTFCSVALIRQDAYGLFLDADSDRRMEVLSALKDLKRGETFRGAGIEWLVLGHDKSVQGLPFRTFVVSADITEKRAFDEGNKCDFAASSLRTYLNGTFLRKLEAEFGAENIPEHDIDLTADDGLMKYGVDKAKIGLLTMNNYRYNRDILTPIGKWWWTATPYSGLDDCGSYMASHEHHAGLPAQPQAHGWRDSTH